MVTTILHTAMRKLKTFILPTLKQKELKQYFLQEVHILYQTALHFDLEIPFLRILRGEEYMTGCRRDALSTAFPASPQTLAESYSTDENCKDGKVKEM